MENQSKTADLEKGKRAAQIIAEISGRYTDGFWLGTEDLRTLWEVGAFPHVYIEGRNLPWKEAPLRSRLEFAQACTLEFTRLRDESEDARTTLARKEKDPGAQERVMNASARLLQALVNRADDEQFCESAYALGVTLNVVVRLLHATDPEVSSHHSVEDMLRYARTCVLEGLATDLSVERGVMAPASNAVN